MSVRRDYLDNITKLEKFAETYYHNNESLISDQSYDLLVEETARAGEDNGWTEHLPLVEKVAAGTVDNDTDIEHTTRMLSLSKANTEEEISKFINKTNPNNTPDFFVLEPKLDGLAVRVLYKNGKREVVATRGDSHAGKNLALRANEITIEGLPPLVPAQEDFEVRGEIFITNTHYEEVQKTRNDLWAKYEAEKSKAKAEKRRATMTAPSKPFTLQRAAASGSINAKPGTETTGIILSFAAYDVIFGNEADQPETYTLALDFATKNGITTASSIMADTADQPTILDKVRKFGEIRGSLDYPTDGAVLKVNSKQVRESLGEGEKHPYWAIAYKYEEEVKEAVLSRIERAVGKSGAISYVGIFENPIDLGSQVSRATLNNSEVIKNLDVRVGDTILVRKANGIIPEILAVRIADREKNSVGEPYEAPTTCPSCGENLDTESSIIWRCHNPECSRLEEIVYAVSKKNLDVQSLGRSTIEVLVENEIINDVADLFMMTREQWENLIIRYTGDDNSTPVLYGKAKTDTVMDSLNKALNAPLNKIISSLNLRYVGNTFGKRFAQHFNSFDKFVTADVDQMTDIQGVKDKAKVIVDEIQKRQTLISKYKNVGFKNIEPKTEEDPTQDLPQVLKDERIVITGPVPDYARDEIKDIIEQAGGVSSSSVSAKTTLVVAPIDKRQTEKAARADKMKITIITPEELLERLDPFLKQYYAS